MLPYRRFLSSITWFKPVFQPIRSFTATRALFMREPTSTQQPPPGQKGNPLSGASVDQIDHMLSSEPFYNDYFNVESFFQPPRAKRPKRRRAVDPLEEHVTELPQPPSEIYKHHPMLNTAFDWSPFVHPDEAMPEMKVDIEETENQYVIQAEVPGVQKKDIHLHLHGNYITIRAEKKMVTLTGGGVEDQRAGQMGSSPARGTPTPNEIPSSAAPTASEEAVAADKVDVPLPKYQRRTERSYGMVERTFSLPKDAQQEQIRATYEAGVLKVIVPRTKSHQEKLGQEIRIM